MNGFIFQYISVENKHITHKIMFDRKHLDGFTGPQFSSYFKTKSITWAAGTK